MRIVTHSGPFHADDAFGAAVIRIKFPGETIKRTRDRGLISEADIAFDVGAEYDPERGRFDHHQRGGAGARENGVPFSSFGLLWKEYGRELVSSEAVWTAVDEELVQCVDALDCGLAPVPEGTKHMYRPFSVSRVISGMNPLWNDLEQDFDGAFMRAVELASGVLQSVIDRAEAKELAAAEVDAATSHEDGRILVLDRFCPWQERVLDPESGHSEVTFMVFPQGETWMVFQVPVKLGAFEGKRQLPEEWAGLRDSDLVEVTGVEDAVFCHVGRFCGGAKSRQGAINLATLALR